MSSSASRRAVPYGEIQEPVLVLTLTPVLREIDRHYSQSGLSSCLPAMAEQVRRRRRAVLDTTRHFLLFLSYRPASVEAALRMTPSSDALHFLLLPFALRRPTLNTSSDDVVTTAFSFSRITSSCLKVSDF